MSVRRIKPVFPHGTYEYRLGHGVTERLAHVVRERNGGNRVLVVRDMERKFRASGIAELFEAEGYEVSTHTLGTDGSPRTDTLDAATSILGAATTTGLTETDAIVAVGDAGTLAAAGFAASTYRGGIDLITIPVDALTMVDAGAGEPWRVAIDTEGTSFAAVEHSPLLVLAEMDALSSGVDEDMRAALLAILRTGLLDRSHHFEQFGRDVEKLMVRDEARVLAAFIRGIEGKARVQHVAHEVGLPIDEPFWFGETFARALGAVELGLTGAERLAEGLRFESRLAVEVAGLDPETVFELDRSLAALAFEIGPFTATAHELFEALEETTRDRNATLRFTLVSEPGEFAQYDVDHDIVMNHLSALVRSRGGEV